MGKKTFVVVGISLVIISAFLYVLFMPRHTLVVEKDTRTKGKSSNDEPIKSGRVSPGKYTDYSEKAVASASGTKLLFFHAPWCPQCREIEASIQDRGLPDNVTVFKVDYDSNQALRQKYGVTIQTTFVKIGADGSKIAGYVAYEEPQFSSVQRELLP